MNIFEDYESAKHAVIWYQRSQIILKHRKADCMFTGIIEEVGEIQSIKKGANSAVITIKASTVLGDLHLGDSVALNGVCLTAVSIG